MFPDYAANVKLLEEKGFEGVTEAHLPVFVHSASGEPVLLVFEEGSKEWPCKLWSPTRKGVNIWVVSR